MQTILQDRIIRKLAQTCSRLAYKLDQQKPPSAFIHAAMFAVNGENRLRDESGMCIGAIELELLGRRDALREKLQAVRHTQSERSHASHTAITADIEQDGGGHVYRYDVRTHILWMLKMVAEAYHQGVLRVNENAPPEVKAEARSILDGLREWQHIDEL